MLPEGYYARSEAVTQAQEDGTDALPGPPPDLVRWEVDIAATASAAAVPAGGVALTDAPALVALGEPLPPRRRLVIRHRSGERVVALIELASPGNRDAAPKVDRFADKVEDALRAGVHVLLIDPFPPTAAAPAGLHGAVAERFGASVTPDPARPLAFVGYKACPDARASVQGRAVGEAPPRVPLFLDPGWFVFVDLAPSYAAATADLAQPTLEALAAPAGVGAG